MKKLLVATLVIFFVTSYSYSYAQCPGGRCGLSGGGYWTTPFYSVGGCANGQCGVPQVIPQQVVPQPVAPAVVPQPVPQPVAPAVVPEPVPQPVAPVTYDFTSYVDAVDAAFADLDRRITEQRPYVACERDIRVKLRATNRRIVASAHPLFSPDQQSGRGFISGDVLRDSQLRLMAASAALNRFGDRDLGERFMLEACWVSKWRALLERDPRPAEAQVRLWRRIATIWSRNAEWVGGTVLVREAPYDAIAGTLSPEAAAQIQSGSAWSKIFGVDIFFSSIPGEWTSSRSWFFFKIIPAEFFHGEKTIDDIEVVEHPLTTEEVRQLDERLGHYQGE